MSNEEILKKAIEKAIEGGYNVPRERVDEYMGLIMLSDVFGVIFSHDFAKAFWGEEESQIVNPMNLVIDKNNNCQWKDRPLKNWEVYLQQMVLEENPILYLNNFLD